MSSNTSWGLRGLTDGSMVSRVRTVLGARGESSHPTHPHVETPHEVPRFQPSPLV